MTKIKKKSYLLLLFLILVLVSFLTFSKKQTIDTYNSNNYSIKIKAKDSFSFGPNKIFIYYKTKDDIFYNHLFDTLLFNDGSTISKDNFKTNISEIQSNQSIFLLRKYI